MEKRGSVDVYGSDIYIEPEGARDTLANLGPLRPMAGTWEGTKGADEHPVVDGTGRDSFIEHYELHPIDFQTNGPQLFYGLRYHTHIINPQQDGTFHDQVGYWLWEPLACTVTLTLGIPRGQVLLASGHAEPDAEGLRGDRNRRFTSERHHLEPLPASRLPNAQLSHARHDQRRRDLVL